MARETSVNEDEWFKRNESQILEDNRRQREKVVADRLARETEEQREELKRLHWMRCPKCGHAMNTTDIDGIAVDTCSLCEGIFFDHGELEELLMRKQEKRFHFYRRLFGLD
jgi:uncharacterized protein